MQLDGQTCVLTGATGGIGRALAGALAAAGARLILAGRHEGTLEGIAGTLPKSSVAALHTGDLTDPSCRAALAALAASLDAGVLINLCGANRFGLFSQQRDDDIQELITLNLITPMALTRALLPHLQSRQAALIVNVGSAFGIIGFPSQVIYSASKFGLRGFSEALARELADGPVRVVHVAPRATRTAMNPARVSAMNHVLGNRVDTPARVAAQIIDIIGSGRRHASLGWPERLFARVNQVMPAIVDRAVARQLATIKGFATDDTVQKDPAA